MRGSFSIRFAVLVMAMAAAVIVGGCGGGDDGETSGGDPKAEIKSVVAETFAFEDADVICEEKITEDFLAASYEGKDNEARLEACKEDEPAVLKEITVTKVKVNGNTATAVLTHTNQNGRRADVPIRLRNEDGWKVDGIG